MTKRNTCMTVTIRDIRGVTTLPKKTFIAKTRGWLYAAFPKQMCSIFVALVSLLENLKVLELLFKTKAVPEKAF